MTDKYYQSVRDQINASVKQGNDPKDVFWAVIEGSAAVVDGATGGCMGGVVSGGLQTMVDTVTQAHLYKLQSIAKGHKKSETLSGWIDLLIKMKKIKGAVRGTQLADAAIPMNALQIGAAAAKLGSASNMLYEIFARRGATRIFGKSVSHLDLLALELDNRPHLAGD